MPAGGPPTLYDAVYETALEQQVPKPLVDRLVRIFAFDVDFQQRVAPGDSMEILHSMADPTDKDAGDPEILYASLSLGSTVKRFYRFRTPDDGIVDYYDEDGKSAKKFLIRKPVPVGRLTSGFGYRRHPILGRMILHAGVDYAAPRGTPILAAGNGIVEKAGRSSGYGNLIVIKHTNGYETAYGHQSRFAKGIAPGVRVHQGQVIGYVGSTGLSTGPARPLRDPGQPPAGRPACASACRAAVCSRANISPPSSASASASTRFSTTRRSPPRRSPPRSSAMALAASPHPEARPRT